MNRTKSISVIVVLAIVGGFVLLGWRYFSRPSGGGSNLDVFAQCLRDKGITMYGAEWCSHCQAEKTRFGESFRFVPYVECSNEPQKCLDLGIEGYPTWIIPGSGTDEQKLVGEQGLEKLSQESGCVLPARIEPRTKN